LEKTETDPPLNFEIFKNRNAHPGELRANWRSGNGDFDDTPHPYRPFTALPEGVSFACCLLFDGSTARKMPYTPQD